MESCKHYNPDQTAPKGADQTFRGGGGGAGGPEAGLPENSLDNIVFF